MHHRRGPVLSRQKQIKIRKLLRKTQWFSQAVYCGPIYANWNGKFLFYDVDFYRKHDTEPFCSREFIKGKFKNLLKEIEQIFGSSNCRYPTTIRINGRK